MDLSIVIPAYNEEGRIGSTIDSILGYLKNHLTKIKKWEIIVVDDGSTDRTIAVVIDKKRKASGVGKGIIRLIRNSTNRGKGYAVRTGIMSARYQLTLFSDADMATPIDELDKFLTYISDFDIVIASRYLKRDQSRVNQSWYRHVLGEAFNLAVRTAIGLEFRDCMCGFKLFKTGIAKKIFRMQKIERFCFDVELLFLAKKLNFQVKEVPVAWVNKRGGKISLIRDPMNMFLDMIRVKLNSLKGKYD